MIIYILSILSRSLEVAVEIPRLLSRTIWIDLNSNYNLEKSIKKMGEEVGCCDTCHFWTLPELIMEISHRFWASRVDMLATALFTRALKSIQPLLTLKTINWEILWVLARWRIRMELAVKKRRRMQIINRCEFYFLKFAVFLQKVIKPFSILSYLTFSYLYLHMIFFCGIEWLSKGSFLKFLQSCGKHRNF